MKVIICDYRPYCPEGRPALNANCDKSVLPIELVDKMVQENVRGLEGALEQITIDTAFSWQKSDNTIYYPAGLQIYRASDHKIVGEVIKVQDEIDHMSYGAWCYISSRLSDCKQKLLAIAKEHKESELDAGAFAVTAEKLKEIFDQGLLFDNIDKTKTLRFFAHYGNERVRVTVWTNGKYKFEDLRNLK